MSLTEPGNPGNPGAYGGQWLLAAVAAGLTAGLALWYTARHRDSLEGGRR